MLAPSSYSSVGATASGSRKGKKKAKGKDKEKQVVISDSLISDSGAYDSVSS